MKELIMKVKKALLNPLLILTEILDLPIEKEMLYTNMVYTTLYQFFNSLFPAEELEDGIDKILEYAGVDDEDLYSIIKSDKPLKKYMQLAYMTEEKFTKMRGLVCSSVLQNKNKELIDFVNDYVKGVELDESTIYNELYSLLEDEYSEKEVKTLSLFFTNRVREVLDMLSGKHIKEKEKKMSKKAVKSQNIEEMRQNVNALDKAYGCRLKHPVDTVDTEGDFIDRLSNYKVILTETIVKINGMAVKKFIKKGRDILGNKLKTAKKFKIDGSFKKKSRWFSDEEVDVNTVTFNLRFITYSMKYVLDRLEELCDRYVELEKPGKFIEYESKVDYIDDVVCQLADTASRMYDGEKVPMTFMSDLEISMSDDKAKHVKKKMEKIENQTDLLRIRLQNPWRGQDVAIDTICKMAYLLSTNEYKSTGCVSFIEGLKFRHRDNIKELIRELGKSIYKSRKRKGVPKLFKLWIEADPIIYCRWEDDDKYLHLGAIALQYYAYMSGSKLIQRAVDKMVC